MAGRAVTRCLGPGRRPGRPRPETPPTPTSTSSTQGPAAGPAPAPAPGTTHTGGGSTHTGDTGTTGPPPALVTVVEGGPVLCEDPGLREAEGAFQRLSAAAEADKPAHFTGGGAIIAHFDDTGGPWVVLPGMYETDVFQWHGDPERDFMDARPDSIAGITLTMGSGGAAADYDGDGDLDLLVTRFEATDVLLRNDGGVFTDVSAQAGLDMSSPNRSVASSWADYDGDGDLDLFIGSYGELIEGVDQIDFPPADDSFLYRNNGDATFTDLSATLPESIHDGYTFSGGFLDLNGDKLPELFIANDFGSTESNKLMWNRGGGVLELDDGSAGLHLDGTSMGVGYGDLNGDHKPDLVLSQWRGYKIYESTGSRWADFTALRGLVVDEDAKQKVPWGIELADMDNDGAHEILAAMGYVESRYNNAVFQPDALYRWNGVDETWEDVGPDWGLANTIIGRGFGVADLNGDGMLDLVKRDLDGPSRLFVSRCGANRWARIRLRMLGMNTRGIGAVVRLTTDAGTQIRWMLAGGTNFASSHLSEVHFGLGQATRIDRIEVDWPDGRSSVVDDLAPDQVLTLSRID